MRLTTMYGGGNPAAASACPSIAAAQWRERHAGTVEAFGDLFAAAAKPAHNPVSIHALGGRAG